jgi:type IV pilus assembly protein PilY1
MSLFFDAYSGQACDAGQPIAAAPILSLDPHGQVTLALATGDQEVFTSPEDMKNYLWSLTETISDDGTQKNADANWYYEFMGGERVAGPISLFNGALYFSSFQPAEGSSGGACTTGTSRVGGMDYIVPEDENDLSLGGKARLPESEASNPTLVQFLDTTSDLLADDASIFGVGITQVPTCANETEIGDEFFGGTATHTTLGSITPSKFQLVMHTGSESDLIPGGSARVKTIDLPTPFSPPRIESWAATVE